MNTFQAFIDGGSRGNPGNAASAFALSLNKQHIITRGETVGIQTNNMAEYLALSHLVLHLADMKVGPVVVDVFCDSLLVVNQIKGVWRTKDKNMAGMKDVILIGAKDMDITLRMTHVGREKNTEADAAVNKVLDELAARKKAGKPEGKVVSEWDHPLTCTAADWPSKFFTNL